MNAASFTSNRNGHFGRGGGGYIMANSASFLDGYRRNSTSFSGQVLISVVLNRLNCLKLRCLFKLIVSRFEGVYIIV